MPGAVASEGEVVNPRGVDWLMIVYGYNKVKKIGQKRFNRLECLNIF